MSRKDRPREEPDTQPHRDPRTLRVTAPFERDNDRHRSHSPRPYSALGATHRTGPPRVIGGRRARFGVSPSPCVFSIRPSASVAAGRRDRRWTGQARVLDPDTRTHRAVPPWRNNWAPRWLVVVAR